MGFYRIYFHQAYLHEVYAYMPAKGYDYEDTDPRFEDKKYFQEYEDQAELTMKVKNYMEGYYDSIRSIKIRINNMLSSREAFENARNAYKQIRVY